ncbi:MAG: winged helix-turn-helix domain-containing protein [Tepidisphaerales bacterium]
MATSRHKLRRLALCGRIWLEIGGKPAITEAGADLLEQIEALGSLSEAARRLRFSYRRAWMLLDGMNRRWPTPLVVTAVGGRHGGGARLTEDGRAVLGAYRDLQFRLEHLLDHASAGFIRSVGYPTSTAPT